MPPTNRGNSSGNPKCPICGRHFKYLGAHIARMHGTTLSELQQRRNISTRRRLEETTNSHQETSNLRRDAPEGLVQENTTDSTDSSHQGTPNLPQEPNSISDDDFILDNQKSRIVFNNSTFNKSNAHVKINYNGGQNLVKSFLLGFDPNLTEKLSQVDIKSLCELAIVAEFGPILDESDLNILLNELNYEGYGYYDKEYYIYIKKV
ncbi:41410_t:CDS:2 [Gigaspora margarita]|uniref:41410_t:CDS:1 n=1 Tax=Gigaspora margarita TaxID=4874 RepID=A0ABN7UU32_GIGMA|nr:41410_t:CDS:2 [Gigaspora margarita]